MPKRVDIVTRCGDTLSAQPHEVQDLALELNTQGLDVVPLDGPAFDWEGVEDD